MLRKFYHKTHAWLTGYYNLLLFFLILLFIFRPYDRGPLYYGVWKFLLTCVLLTAIFNCNHNRQVKVIASILAIPTMILSWVNPSAVHTLIFPIDALLTIIFMIICTSSIIYDVVVRARVTLETLRGVVCAYFMVAFAFGYIYYLIEYLVPGTFHFSNRTVSVGFFSQFLSEMLYFSFITLLTIGYGDITSIKDIGQTASVIEGIFGQFYIAILVARLVGVYSFYSNNRLLRQLESDITEIEHRRKPPHDTKDASAAS